MMDGRKVLSLRDPLSPNNAIRDEESVVRMDLESFFIHGEILKDSRFFIEMCQKVCIHDFELYPFMSAVSLVAIASVPDDNSI